ncbi:hypothetical protein PRJ39_06770 [Lysobacter enzymogenes]|uniref:hypothetical protein n=1 Tax=Lysobacter enzymogenes TaxID=69 RepID=UPI0037491623
MIASSFLWLLLAAAPASDADAQDAKSVDATMCGPATEIFLPDNQVAANVRLEHLQYMSPGDPCGRNFKHDEIKLLYERVKAAAVSSFTGSEAGFGVMVRYELAAGSPMEFEMQTKSAPEAEKARLERFYNAASAVKAFQPTVGTVHVVMEYSIAAAPAAEGK